MLGLKASPINTIRTFTAYRAKNSHWPKYYYPPSAEDLAKSSLPQFTSKLRPQFHFQILPLNILRESELFEILFPRSSSPFAFSSTAYSALLQIWLRLISKVALSASPSFERPHQKLLAFSTCLPEMPVWKFLSFERAVEVAGIDFLHSMKEIFINLSLKSSSALKNNSPFAMHFNVSTDDRATARNRKSRLGFGWWGAFD